MRQIILDTETTGLEPSQGHKIIEIGCVEMINRRKTNNHYHQYLNPQRLIEDGAYDVHGISNEFLEDKPLFEEVAQEFIDYVRGAELIIHNAAFDVGFLNAELKALGKKWGKIEDYCKITDSLAMAREMHPGQKNNLDALCKRYEVDNSARDLHGALLDAGILLDVYLAMTGGQTDLSLQHASSDNSVGQQASLGKLDNNREQLKIIKACDDEMSLHDKRIQQIEKASGATSIWRQLNLDA